MRRAQIILAAAQGQTNSEISQHLQLDRAQVRMWRQRWLDYQDRLAGTEASEAADAALRAVVLQKQFSDKRSVSFSLS